VQGLALVEEKFNYPNPPPSILLPLDKKPLNEREGGYKKRMDAIKKWLDLWIVFQVFLD
jgi:hypothetical protein